MVPRMRSTLRALWITFQSAMISSKGIMKTRNVVRPRQKGQYGPTIIMFTCVPSGSTLSMIMVKLPMRKQNRYSPQTKYGSSPLFRLKHLSGMFIKHEITRALGLRGRPPGSLGGTSASSQQQSEHWRGCGSPTAKAKPSSSGCEVRAISSSPTFGSIVMAVLSTAAPSPGGGSSGGGGGTSSSLIDMALRTGERVVITCNSASVVSV
mmetsp:Transcript_34793/g.92873  ORF Transcript_34793/g.92873 Transcript_34793/m.92873 type:complete len:208 (-) Transcript_34793:430-1053(-)